MTSTLTTPPSSLPSPSASPSPRSHHRLRWALLSLVSAGMAVLVLRQLGPTIVIGAVVVVAVAIAVFWRADLATRVFAFLFYANVLVVASRFHGVPTSVASGATLLLLLPILRTLMVERRPIVITPTLGLLFVFLLSMLISVIASPDPDISLPVVGTFLVEGILLYLLVSNVANSVDRAQAIVKVFVVACTLMALLSVYQELSGSYGNDFFGFAQVSNGGFDVGEGSAQALRQRLAGPIGEQNRYAQILLMVVPMAFFTGRVSASLGARLGYYVAAAIIMTGVFLTFSRGAAVAAFAVLVLMVVHGFVTIRQLVTIVVAGALLMFTIAPDYVQRIASIATATDVTAEDTEADGAIKGRTTEALAAVNVFLDHPVIGVGPDRFFREFSQSEANKLDIRRLDSNRRAHNLYLELAADQGVVGLVAFIGIMFATIVQLIVARRRWRGSDPEREALAAALLFAVYGYVLTAFFLQMSYQRYLWAVIGLANGVIWSLRAERPLSPLYSWRADRPKGDGLATDREEIQRIL